MDFNYYPTNFGSDGQADFDYRGGVNHHGYPMSSMPDPQYGLPQNLVAPSAPDHQQQQHQHFDKKSEWPNVHQIQNGNQRLPREHGDHVHVLSNQPGNAYNQNFHDSHHAQHHFNGHEAKDAMPMADHMDLGPAVPVPQQPYMPPTPQELLHVQEVYNAYVASYNDDFTPKDVRLQIANALALELLQHYYPATKGYIVQKSRLGPMAKHGMNLMLKTPDGTNPDYISRPPLSPVLQPKDPKKGKKQKKKPYSKARLAQLNKEKEARERVHIAIHEFAFTSNARWQQMEPEDITGFEVLKKHTIVHYGVETFHYRLHTCLAIVLAPSDLLPQIAETNDVQRGDILTDIFSRSQQIRHGHGILLFGNWLELYDFDNGAETQINGDVEDEYYEGMVSYEEPYVKISQSPDDGQRLALDLRTVGLGVVDEVCQMVVRKEVVHFGELGREYFSGEVGVEGDSEEQFVGATPMSVPSPDITDGAVPAHVEVPSHAECPATVTKVEADVAVLQEQSMLR